MSQNTDNIFRYKHNLITDEYELCEMPLIYSTTGEYINEMPIDFIKSVFDVARNNIENIRNLDKVRIIIYRQYPNFGNTNKREYTLLDKLKLC